MGEFEDKLNKILSSPEEMGKIMDLARSITGSDAPPAHGAAEEALPPATEGNPLSSLLGDLDPSMLKTVGALISGMSEGGGANGSELLEFVSPYLKDERKTQLKRAVQLTKLAKLAKNFI